MREMLLLFLIAAAVQADTSRGDPRTPEQRTPSELVRRLGDKRYAAREAAAKALTDLGHTALPALRDGAQSADAEVRARCAALLPRARAADWRRRADAYLADTEGKQKHDLPLLAKWEKFVGTPDVGARKLFAEMVRTNGVLLEDAAAGPGVGRPGVAIRLRILEEVPRTRAGMPAADVAAALLAHACVGTDPDIDPRDEFAGRLLRDPGAAAAVAAADVGPAFRRLLAGWAAAQRLEKAGIHYLSTLAARHPLPEVVPQLVRLVKYRGGGTSRGNALAGLVRAGTAEAVAALTGMLDDPSDLWEKPAPGQVPSELRACALAALVKRKGTDPAEYGLTPTVRWAHPPDRVVVQLYGFTTEKGRTDGLAKWRAEAAPR